ncbi:low-temperature-induced 65 kDa protein-like isoform X1 [Lycium barbarum]|uniref:low-temperature-induced 65 kDa protein-like isoform X1 n=1 Tax=Lycium barbarum TaxID=112863 RepID=UPI00293F4614|nr:low-temperature-induced 65 kDa protein-like isoform X1 [Lycium barbarum]
MEAQLNHPQGTRLHSGEGHGQVHDEGEHHHKTSVLNKVKAKAKKFTDHLKHGLGHEHEHDPNEEEEEVTDDEQMEEGAEVHGGPYAVRSKDIRKEDIGPMGKLENPTSPKEDRYDSMVKNDQEVHRPTLQRQDESARPPSLEGTHFPEERHRPPFAESHENKGTDHVTSLEKHQHQGLQGHENIGPLKGLEANPPYYSHEEMDRPPVAASETHEPKGFDHVTSPGKLIQGLHVHKMGELAGIEEDPHAPKDRPKMKQNPTNYQSKVNDPTGANNEEAGVSPLVHSFDKMGVNDAPETTRKQGTERIIRPGPVAGDMKLDQGTEHRQYTGSHDQFAPQETPADFPSVREDTESIPKSMNPSKPEDLPQDTLTGKPGSYTEKISSATTAIADKAVAAKNVVASKLGYGGPEEESSKPEDLPHDTTGKPGSYTEKISSATSVISEKAVAAKNVVASKLGYGGTEEGTNKSSTTESDNNTAKTTSVAQTVAGKLAPVYEKVAGAGSTVMAKVQGTATGVTGHETRGGVDAEHEGKIKETDKGVSMKEYLAEKFMPGEEDKALSEVISGSLSRQKEKKEEAKPMGKVTESEEVERRLGPIEDGASGETHVGEGFGQNVVGRVTGAFSTWLGKGGEAQANDSAVGGGGGAVVGGEVE